MHLAKADEADLMAEWAGLGYYARARNLLKCAKAVALTHEGLFPKDYETLLALPGVGAYTAAAIMAFAYDKPTNVVDANIERIMARLYAVKTPMPKAKSELVALAATWVRADRARDWPQALMDLATLVCRPKSPDCEACPLNMVCTAFAEGHADSYPIRAKRAKKLQKHGFTYVIIHKDKLFVERRKDQGLLGGMLGFPHSEWCEKDIENKQIKHLFNVRALAICGTVEHTFTHFHLTQTVCLVTYDDAWSIDDVQQATGLFPLNIESVKSLPTAFRKAADVAINAYRSEYAPADHQSA